MLPISYLSTYIIQIAQNCMIKHGKCNIHAWNFIDRYVNKSMKWVWDMANLHYHGSGEGHFTYEVLYAHRDVGADASSPATRRDKCDAPNCHVQKSRRYDVIDGTSCSGSTTDVAILWNLSFFGDFCNSFSLSTYFWASLAVFSY